MQPGNRYAAPVIEPNDNAASLRIDPGMLRARNAIAVTTGGHYLEGFERPSTQQLTNIPYHAEQPTELLHRTQVSQAVRLVGAAEQFR